MLALAAANVFGAVAFAGVYAAGSRLRDAPAVFVVAMLLALVGVTALWVYVEQRSRALEVISRIGRGVIALLMVAIGLPMVVLMPLFWLESQLPPEAVPDAPSRIGHGAAPGLGVPRRRHEHRRRARGDGARHPSTMAGRPGTLRTDVRS